MAVTPIQLETLVTSAAGVPFRQRVEFALVAIAENISTEAGNTALHAQRKALATQIMLSPDNYVTNFAQGLIAQLPLASTNMVTVNAVPNADVDTTDASFQTILASIFNDYFP
jgi:hypothetical protein